MNTPIIYISVSDEKGHLTIDGPLDLLRDFLATIQVREKLERRGLLPAGDRPAEEHPATHGDSHE